ncbi:MAG: hypothetical protein HFJ51_00025 [Clostridia bacterium]|nr:hypothetical protein [Clostridia bacterium]
MKQIEKSNICNYCFGCNKEEQEEFKPVMRCENFVSAIEDWQEKLREELKKNGR